ncbi:hypothetical protein M9H77_18527 [Catharanthus roseus]|uniref:Uncharacterized protein n=1 Tax=Catharanthus roseus TaxID=4058 RepID=A0ACC0B7P6_CATRO|nr:hypothetical protein M9H77_18527 [Catharanthus roseus]
MAGEQPIRPKRFLALGHDDQTLTPLVRTRYSFSGSLSTATSFATPATPVIRSSMKDIDERIEEGYEGEHNAEGIGSSRSDLEVVGVTPGTGLRTGLEEEPDFDEVTKVLIGDAGVSGQKLTGSIQT